jgi:uracil-DNA glycosylase
MLPVRPLLQGSALREVEPKSLDELNALIEGAKPLVPGATRAVLGEGPVGAAVALVGEQPGDQEDRQGRPFVGPAGRLLDRAMAEAGLDRKHVYITNAVKHFKFEQRGKRRIHKKPTVGEVKHYRWWLDQELKLVHPEVVVAMGATAVLALAGKSLPISRFRGPAELQGRRGYITVHPSYLLRLTDRDAKVEAYRALVRDLRSIHKMVCGSECRARVARKRA